MCRPWELGLGVGCVGIESRIGLESSIYIYAMRVGYVGLGSSVCRL